ncbi:hypothetical protein ACEWY4_025853 [Coilia grayii]|uniref:E3 ubiquitin-protein ligase n=1 Tax=Coilia grayii TaxID=363190 RepID=A0ABD1IX55_9TELE
MGSILSRRIAGVEDIDIQANSAYRYPPKSGNYFTSHFFMGGEKFDTPHPEGYLFGENMDLNFLGNRPVQFPYVTPAPHEPVKTLRSLVNIRKDSLRLVRYKDDADGPADETGSPRVLYGVEFSFDADARVAITIYCQAFEEFANGMAIYSPKSPWLASETVHYKRGINQHYSVPSFKIDFTKWKPEELNFDLDRGVYPMVIQAVVDEGEGRPPDISGHAHVLLAVFERHVDGSFSVKPLKQKQIVDRVSYLLQEIYGIENKNKQDKKTPDDENSDNSSECVVCLSDLRDTLILPCRHLCLCNACADTLRYQANNCPICRLPFRALLQIRAVRKKAAGSLPPVSFSTDHTEHSQQSSDNIPPGYEAISLLEALNGICAVPSPIPSAPLYEEIQFPTDGGGDPLALSRPQSVGDLPGDTATLKGKGSKSPDSSTRSPSSPIQEEEDEERMSEVSDVRPHSLLPCSPVPTEVTMSEGSTEAITPNSDGYSLVHSVSDVGCHSERSSLTGTESTPSTELALPGSSSSMESLKSRSTSSSSQPLLCLPSSLHLEDEGPCAHLSGVTPGALEA